jgi:putative (di)nucleoside polyphosphate hydrolase
MRRSGALLVFCSTFRFNRAKNFLDVKTVVDADGYRPNVGIVLSNDLGQVLWARRVGGRDAWQFPQGGINEDESLEEALYRELHEEVGLSPDSVQILARTQGWLRYRLPKRLRRHNSTPGFKGQKQKWFLLRMLADDQRVQVDITAAPEFDHWRWVSYWYPVCQVVDFKRDVYRRALKELAPHLPYADPASGRSTPGC